MKLREMKLKNFSSEVRQLGRVKAFTQLKRKARLTPRKAFQRGANEIIKD